MVGSRLFGIGLASFLILGLVPVSASAHEAIETDTRAPRSLDEPPTLEPGEWWRVSVQERLSGIKREGYVVVQDYEDGYYTFGVDHGSIHPVLFNFHALPLGRVSADDFGYDVHGSYFEALQFPLTQGATWATSIGHASVEAKVVKIEESQATIVYRGHDGIVWARGTYDAQLGFFTHLRFDEPGEMHVLDHGFEYGCSSYSPIGLRMAFESPHSLTPHNGAFSGPLFGHHEVGPQVEFLSLSLVVGTGSGVAEQEVVAPDGTVIRAQANAQNHHQTVLEVFDRPAGRWTFHAMMQGDSYALVQAMVFSIRSVPAFGTPGDECGDTQPRPRLDMQAFVAAPVEEASAESTMRTWTFAIGIPALATFAFWRRGSWIILGLYAKLSKPEALAHPLRVKIITLVRADPGIVTQEIRHELGIAWGTTVYHVNVLEQHGLLVALTWGRNRHWFDPTSVPPKARPTALASRRPQAHRLLAHVEKHPGSAQGEIAKELHIHHATLIFHAKRLQGLGLVEKRRERGRIRYFPTTTNRSV